MPQTIASEDTPFAESVSRRRLLLGAGAVITAAAAGVAFADTHSTHADHGAHGAKYTGLAEATYDCIARGQACTHHCLEEFKAGSTSLADCAARVQEMTAVCGAFGYLVAADAPRLKEYARVCVDVCKDCEKECRKHEEHHSACKACAEACARLVTLVEKTLA